MTNNTETPIKDSINIGKSNISPYSKLGINKENIDAESITPPEKLISIFSNNILFLTFFRYTVSEPKHVIININDIQINVKNSLFILY